MAGPLAFQAYGGHRFQRNHGSRRRSSTSPTEQHVREAAAQPRLTGAIVVPTVDRFLEDMRVVTAKPADFLTQPMLRAGHQVLIDCAIRRMRRSPGRHRWSRRMPAVRRRTSAAMSSTSATRSDCFDPSRIGRFARRAMAGRTARAGSPTCPEGEVSWRSCRGVRRRRSSRVVLGRTAEAAEVMPATTRVWTRF